MKTTSSKRRKIELFPKGLVHGLGQKLATFPIFYFKEYRPGKCPLRYSRTKIPLSKVSKQEVEKVEKVKFFQRR